MNIHKYPGRERELTPEEMTIPPQKYKLGDLVQVIDRVPMTPLEVGDILLITNVWCAEVCTKGGKSNTPLELGGAGYGMEWGYTGTFAKNSGWFRLDSLMPLEVVS